MRVLCINIDTLRPDHLGCYGYPRNTSPNLDALAQEEVRFERCYISDAPCLPSRAALLTGIFGIRNGTVGHGGTAADYINLFEGDELPTWITPDIFKHHQSLVAPHGVNEIGKYTDRENPAFPKHPGKLNNHGELRRVWDGYDCGIHYADSLLGQVFDLLKEQGIYEDTAIILSSDHEENLGELGIYGEHGTADDITCRVSLIIKWKGAKKGHVDTAFHYSLDLLPTLADLLGVPKQAHWDGQSFADTLLKGVKMGRDHLVISQMAHVCQRSARFEDWLYIRTIHDGFRLFDKEMLFNLKDDLHEQFDIKDDYPEVCARGAKMILDWQEEMMIKGPQTIDPMWTVMSEGRPFHTRGELEGYLKRLIKTGRAEGAARLKAKHGKK